MMTTENFWFEDGFDPHIRSWIEQNSALVSDRCAMGALACQDNATGWASEIRQAFPDAWAEVHHGFFNASDGDDDEWGDGQEGHTWVVVNNSIFDPTAAQFDKFPNISSFDYETTDVEDADMFIESLVLEQAGSEYADSLGLIELRSRYSTTLILVELSKLNLIVQGSMVEDAVVGMIFLTSKKYDDTTPCWNSWEVLQSVVDQKGIGRLLYGLARAYADERNSTIMPDRRSVTKDAERIWKYAFGSLKKKPFDDVENPQTPNKEDDCEVYPNYREVLNYAYEDSSYVGLRKKMKSAADEIMSDLESHEREQVEDEISIQAGALFRSKYE